MYQALYRKYRPRVFDDVVGQPHITQTLKNQVSTERLSHAYLFVGTRGTGKTTCAKILARAINCLHPIDGNPCNECASCRGIESGAVLDVLELDAASNNGVDNVRALRDEAIFTPASVKKRVYIIDEVHMLTTQAFNALLKILEEPPEHLVFILATTELHKVPATILSRCQRFSFRRIDEKVIAERVKYVANREGTEIDDDAAALLARLSDGALRDALSLLDRCSGVESITAAVVRDEVGLSSRDETIGLLTAVSSGDVTGALSLLDTLYRAGRGMSAVLEELSQLARDVLVYRLMKNGSEGLRDGGFDEKDIARLAKNIGDGELYYYLDTLEGALRTVSRGSGEKLRAELCVMSLCSDRLSDRSSALVSRISALEKAVGEGKARARIEPRIEAGTEAREEAQAEPRAEARVEPGAEARVEPGTAAESAPVPEVVQGTQPEPTREIAQEAPPEPTYEATQEPQPEPTPEPAPERTFWDDVLAELSREGEEMVLSLLGDKTTARLDGGELTITAATDFAKSTIERKSVMPALLTAARMALGRDVTIKCELQKA